MADPKPPRTFLTTKPVLGFPAGVAISESDLTEQELKEHKESLVDMAAKPAEVAKAMDVARPAAPVAEARPR